MFGIGMPELIVILVIALVVFGPQKLPELARSLGKGLNELKKATNDFRQEMDSEAKKDEPAAPPPPAVASAEAVTPAPPPAPAEAAPAGKPTPPAGGATA